MGKKTFTDSFNQDRKFLQSKKKKKKANDSAV